MHPSQLPPLELIKHCQESRTRRPGPGGQHRNKVETAVILHHERTGISAEANERRSQADNRNVALFRLRVTLALDVRSDAVESPSLSPLWLSRIANERIRVNPEHADFPALLAEALDAVARNEFDLKVASEQLQVTASQLLKFLKLEPRALGLVNRARIERGLHVFV